MVPIIPSSLTLRSTHNRSGRMQQWSSTWRRKPQNPSRFERRLDSLSRRSYDECCIYRVPERLRGRIDAYTPQVVSIGPFHHGRKHLEDMEEDKQRYLRHLLRRNEVSFEHYVEKIKDKEEKLRGCYGNAKHLKSKSSDQFVSIILVDAAFVIELLVRNFEDEKDNDRMFKTDNDRIFKKPWILTNILPDMLLLENQLPSFILEDLFDASKVRVKNSETERPSMIKLSYHFFKKVVGLQRSEDQLEWTEPPLHFVDFIRTLHVQYLNTGTSEAEELPCIPSVTKLHQAGVKFRPESSDDLFAMQFHNGTLKIPKLEIHDDTELILRNLIAFEQCHCTDKYLISDYVFLLDKFVNTKRDVDLLVESEIVVNTLGDNNKVSTMINQLCKGVAPDQRKFYFGVLAADLNNYCKKCRNRWLAYLSQKYFYTPWAAFSLVAAVTLLILTVIQTVFAIISFYRQ